MTADCNRVTGWMADDVHWSGVASAVLPERAGLRPGARVHVSHAFDRLDGGFLSRVPLDLATAPDMFRADSLDGAPLPPQQERPLRLVVPSRFGCKSVKWVVRLGVTSTPAPCCPEQRSFQQYAPVTRS